MGNEREAVLILTNEDDHAADAVEEGLARARIPTIRWDPGTVPEIAAAGAWFHDGAWTRLRWRSGAGTHDLSRVGVVWVRRPSPPKIHGLPEVVAFVAEEATSLGLGLWSVMQAAWVNDVTAGRRAGSKPLQLAVASEVGWQTPETYIGNDPEEVRRLWERTAGRVIMKPFTLAAVPGPLGLRAPYTRRLSPADLEDQDAIWASPAIWQEAIDKAFELRITVVGEDVWAGAIDSQASDRTRDDWRRYDFEKVAHSAYEVPETVRDRCLALVTALGLRFGAIDVIVTPDGRYVFLEINPFGQWLWMEQLCGLPIATSHVKLFKNLLSRDGGPDHGVTGSHPASRGPS